MGWEAGQRVIVYGIGLGTITSLDEERIVVAMAEGNATAETAHADELMRPAADAKTAQEYFARLCERSSAARSLPPLTSLRAMERAPLERQVDYLRLYFRKRKELELRESEIVQVVSDDVLLELATALGVDAARLRAAVKSGKPTFEPKPARPLPSPPEIPGLELRRSFWSSASMYVGEWPEVSGSGRVKVAVRPGAWHAYVVKEEGEDVGAVLRHDAVAKSTHYSAAAVAVRAVNVEGGQLGVLDCAALRDPIFGADEVERSRRDGAGFADRGVELATLGDGDHEIFVDDKSSASLIFLAY